MLKLPVSNTPSATLDPLPPLVYIESSGPNTDLLAEKRRLAKIREEELRLEKIQKTLFQMWRNHIIPNWASAINGVEYTKKTRRLLYLGIPTKFRGEVWKKAIGNELQLKEQSYYLALERARKWEVRGVSQERDGKWGLIEAAETDMEFSFPELKMFQRGMLLHEDLVDVVKAYIMYRSDVKVIFGIHVSIPFISLRLVCVLSIQY